MLDNILEAIKITLTATDKTQLIIKMAKSTSAPRVGK